MIKLGFRMMLPMNTQGKLTTARPAQNMKSISRMVSTQDMMTSSRS